MAEENEFARMLRVLDWSDGRASASLEVEPERIARWRSGQVSAPSEMIRTLQKLMDIHTPGETASNEWSRTTSSAYRNTVDNPHDNWHGDDVHRAQAAAERRERESRAREEAAERDRTRARAADRAAAEEPAPQVVPSSSSEEDLLARLVALRESYKELSGAYSDLRTLYARDTGNSPPTLFRPHDVLNVRPDASWEDVRDAYKVRSRANHPDKGGDLAVMQELSEAYAELKALFGR